MRQLLPTAVDEVEPYDAYRPGDPGGALVRINMVTSLDGAVTDAQGRSGGLGGSGDREAFRALRAHADAILVGAGTARAEGYGPHRVRADVAERRRADGRAQPAAIVVVSRSLDLDVTSPLFTEAVTPTVVLTCGAAPEHRRRAVAQAGGVVVAGGDEVDLPAGLARLRDDLGAVHVLCEGGPTLNAALLGAGLADELCVTLAPALVDGGGPRLAGTLAEPAHLALVAAFEHDGELLLRYRVTVG